MTRRYSSFIRHTARFSVLCLAPFALLVGCQEPIPSCVDSDGDGYGHGDFYMGDCAHPDQADCDDDNAAIHPDADEGCDGIDNDCDGALGAEELDDDGDGLTECGGDCDDTEPAIHPYATEACNAIDDNCDTVVDEGFDADEDAVTTCGPDGISGNEDDDCDDGEDTTYPGAPEFCDEVDNDCDGDTDEPEDIDYLDYYPDEDGDTYGDEEASPVNDCAPVADHVTDNTDCDDGDETVYPGADELCDGLDNDCDAALPLDELDEDGDGFMVCEDDCDDSNASSYPGATELCDGQDNDCDVSLPADEADDDGDGFMVCEDDCDDTDATTYFGATELCDDIDNDCDGVPGADEADTDGDGFMICEDDCDDGNADTYPGATELCDGQDNDCDLSVPADEADGDADGFMVCENDCDDADASVNPAADEECDGVDTDCDGSLGATEIDADGDGSLLCEPDCDDNDPDTYPGASEICDGVDNNCNGVVPADETDDDGDGYDECGDLDCDDTDPDLYPDDLDGDGFTPCDGDCDDGDAGAYPGATEIPDDGIDQDCDGVDLTQDADIDGILLFANDQTGHREFYVSDPGGGAVTQISSGAEDRLWGAFDPDGTSVVYTAGVNSYGELWRMAVDGSYDVQLNDESSTYSTLDVAWNGDIVTTTSGELYTMNAEGQGRSLIYSGGSDQLAPRWSPEATQIAWSSDKYTCSRSIRIADADGNNDFKLANVYLADWGQVSWSPDGTQIAYATKGDGTCFPGGPADYKLFIVEATLNGAVTQVTTHAGNHISPEWVADDWIYFASDEDGDSDIYLLEISTGLVTRVTDLPGNEFYPRFSYCADADGDGWVTCEGDCDDNDDAINAAAVEVCDDGLDNDCDGDADCDDADCAGELACLPSDWVTLAGDTYDMGSADDGNSQPIHSVTVPTFEMWRTEVTVAQYEQCFHAGFCSQPSVLGQMNWGVVGREDHPINNVVWDQAVDFCSWVGGRLPSESEWEFAARSGGQNITYPWGNDAATCTYAVMDDGGDGCSEGTTWSVCSKTAGNTDQELCDMSGNVWEWVQDWYHADYNGAPDDGSAWEFPVGSSRGVRGGSFDSNDFQQRAASRGVFAPSYYYDDLGIRCAR